MRLECYTAQWTLTAAVAGIILVAYTLGLPVGIALWLRANRHTLEDKTTKDKLAFLYAMYGTDSGQYLWEVRARRAAAVCACMTLNGAHSLVCACVCVRDRLRLAPTRRWWSCCASWR